MSPAILEALTAFVLGRLSHLSLEDARSAAQAALDFITGSRREGDEPAVFAPEFGPALEAVRLELLERAAMYDEPGRSRITPHEGVPRAKPNDDER